MNQLNLLGRTAVVLSLLAGSACLAQLPSIGGAGALGTDFATLSKLFGDHPGFSAKSDFRIYDKNQKEKISATMGFAYLENKFRLEMDMTQIKNSDIPASAGAAMKQLGMDRVVSIVRPEKKASYLIFPGIQSYINTPLSKIDTDAYEKKPRLEKTVLGKETLDAHACVKNKVVTTNDKGEKSEFTVWNATDLKDFPVQILTKEKDDTVIMRYKEVKLARPEAKQFDVPSDFKEYADYTALMQAVMMKMMNDAAAPAPKK